MAQFGAAAPNGGTSAGTVAGTVKTLLRTVGLSPAAPARAHANRDWHQVATAWDALGRGEQGVASTRLPRADRQTGDRETGGDGQRGRTPSDRVEGLTALARTELAAGGAEEAPGVGGVPRAQRLVSGLDQVPLQCLRQGPGVQCPLEGPGAR